MARNKKPDKNKEVQFIEELRDKDGDDLSLDELKLAKIDGKEASNKDPSWLSHTTQTVDGQGDSRIMEVNIRIQTDQIDSGTTYSLKLVGSDNKDEDTLFREIEVD
jgi:hypothetical protein